MGNLQIKVARLCVGLFLLAGTSVYAAPFAKTFTFTQPAGNVVELWGEGDEFSAVFEHNGYSVIFDAARGAYMYASLSADGTELIPTQLEVGQADPVANGLPEHLRAAPETVRAQRRARYEQWDAGMEVSSRWQASKIRMQTLRAQAAGGRVPFAPPNFETVGVKVGLTLLIDFDSVPASVPHAEIVDFLNGDNYTGNGNNGSVKQYFHDVSKGMLTYTNIVTAYVRIPTSLHPRSYYADVSKGSGGQGNLLIMDALTILKGLPEYETEILPLLDELTVDGSDRVSAFNVLYTGGNGGVWAMGLWPHSSSLRTAQDLGNGKRLSRYQITNIGDDLTLGTFCHENGHMLCGYPDFYDYADDDTDSIGGTGNFCLMGYGGDDRNPVQVSAYLKAASGWADVVEVAPGDHRDAELTTSSLANAPNRFYRFEKPGTPKEYFIIENRQKIGRDASIPGSGIAIWHIDEDGDKSNENRNYNTSHQNYEQTLVQADNQWHLHRRRDLAGTGYNYGDANDLWYLGNSAASYANLFTDTSTPSARWWNGSSSTLRLEGFSANGNVMTFAFQSLPPSITTPSALPDGYVGTPYTYSLWAIGGTTPYAWAVVSNTLPDGLTLDGVTGVLAGLPTLEGDYTFAVAVTGDNGRASTNQFSITIFERQSIPYEQNFDAKAGLPDAWHQMFASNKVAWTFLNGSGITSSGNPAAARSAPNNARLGVLSGSLSGSTTWLVSPMLDLGETPYGAELRFWHYMQTWQGNQDRLRIHYRTAPEADWELLQEFNSNVSTWTQRRIALPNPSSTYYVAFEGIARYGYGIHIDDVWIGDPTPPLTLDIPFNGLPDAGINQPYSNVLVAAGGIPPYTFSITNGVLPTGLVMDEYGVITGTGTVVEEDVGFIVLVTDSKGVEVSAEFTLSVVPPRATLFVEDFESGGFVYRKWAEEHLQGNVWWAVQLGGGNAHNVIIPRYPHGGSFNATLYWWSSGPDRDDHLSRLISPQINLGAAPSDIRLTFWHCMAELQGDQDQLRVYARSAPEDAWTLLATYTDNVPEWTRRTLVLPNPTSTYQIAFEGNARYGAGVCLDDIRIMQNALAPIFITANPLKEGAVWVPYSEPLVVGGGVMPYTFGVVDSKPLPDWLVMNTDGVLTGTPTASGRYEFDVWVAGADGLATTNRYHMLVRGGAPLPFSETFEEWSATNGWTQTGTTITNWVFTPKGSVSPDSQRVPTRPHAGTYNACLYSKYLSSTKRMLITPMLNLTQRVENPRLTFSLCMVENKATTPPAQDRLIVWYRTSPTNGWVALQSYTTNVTKWAEMTIDLPEPTDTYQIAFEGDARAGFGVCVDNVSVNGDLVEDGYESWKDENFSDGEDSGDDDDPDNDGLPNIWEYITGRDPNTPDADGAWLNISIVEGYPNLTFPVGKRAYGDGVLWDLETCTNLLIKNDWVPLNIPSWVPPDPDTEPNAWWQIIYPDLASPVAKDPRRFYRLKVTVPQP